MVPELSTIVLRIKDTQTKGWTDNESINKRTRNLGMDIRMNARVVVIYSLSSWDQLFKDIKLS